MSLLEDIFLRDEADEAKALERIIEGDEYDDKPRIRSDSDDDSVKEDEAEEERKRVDPSSTKTKRAVRNPRFILNPARLTGPRGIQVIPEHFKDFKFKGKGYEKEDLDLVLKKLEHWAYRLYPKFKFEDCLKKIETLGKKRPVMVHLHKIRSDQFSSEETVVQKDSSDDETLPVEKEEDEFDKLLRQQIELARSTPAPDITKKTVSESSTHKSPIFTATKVTSSPSISEEQRERMMKSRKLAEERRLARLKNNSVVTNSGLHDTVSVAKTTDQEMNKHSEDMGRAFEEITNVEENVTATRKHNRSNVIDSSDDEESVMCVNQSIRVDIHTSVLESKTVVPEPAKSDTKHNKINYSDINNIQSEIIDEEIVCLETQNDENNQPSEDLLEAIELADEELINYDNRVNSTENETPVVANVNNEKLNTIIEKKNDDEKFDDKETSESFEENRITAVIVTDVNVPANELTEIDNNLTTNDNLVKLDDKQKNVTESHNFKTNTVVNDLDEIMDVDFSEDF